MKRIANLIWALLSAGCATSATERLRLLVAPTAIGATISIQLKMNASGAAP